MGSGTFYPAASADDSTWIIDGSDFWSGLNYNFFGSFPPDNYACAIRFSNVTIPQGAIITSAFVRLTAYQSRTEVVCNANIYFNNEDNPTNPTDVASADGKSVTAKIDWDSISQTTGGVAFDTPELKTILQSIINRGGWSSGNHILILFKEEGESDANAYRDFLAFDYSGGEDKAELHVGWTVDNEKTISEEINILSEFDDSWPEVDENIAVTSAFDNNFCDLSENASVNSEFEVLGSDGTEENVSVNTQIEGDYTKFTSEEASVNSEFISEHTAELSEEASVNSEFGCYTPPANLDATLPLITCDILGGHGGFIEGTLPCITAEIRGGAILEATLPMITADITGKVGIVGELETILPKITASITGKTETLGEIEATLPMVRAYITGKTGEVGELNVTLPMITTTLEGYHDITGELNVTLPMIEAKMVGTVEKDDCTIIRYAEPVL